jgi:hypothetical protein
VIRLCYGFLDDGVFVPFIRDPSYAPMNCDRKGDAEKYIESTPQKRRKKMLVLDHKVVQRSDYP